MGAYNIVDPTKLVSGQPEDISVVLSNLQAIAAILNGGIDNTNINAAAAIAASKLAAYPTSADKFLRGDGQWTFPKLAGAHVSRQVSNQTIANSTNTAVTFDTENADDQAFFDAGAADRLTIPAGWAGRYKAVAKCQWSGASGAGNFRQASLQINGAFALDIDNKSPTTAYRQKNLIVWDGPLGVGDYIRLMVQQDSGGNLDLDITGAFDVISLSLYWINF